MFTQSQIQKDSSKNRLLFGIILVYLAIVIPLSAILNIWYDEVYTLNTTGKTLEYAWNQALHYEHQAPVYFLLLTVWRSINKSIFFARLFSVICICISIYLAPKVSERYLKEIHPGWLTAIIALNPYTFYAALEIRLYAFAILLSEIILILLHDGYLSKQSQKKSRIGYIFINIIAIYTQYYFGFLFIANALAVLVNRRWNRIKSYLIASFIVGLFIIPVLFIVKQQISNHEDYDAGIDHIPVFSEFVRTIIIGKFSMYVTPIHFSLPTLIEPLRFARLIIFCLFLLLAFRNCRTFSPEQKSIIAIVVGLIFSFYPVYHYKGIGILQHHHTVALYIPLLLFTLFVFYESGKSFSKRIVVPLGSSFLLGCYMASSFFIYKPLSKIGEWIEVASYVEKYELSNQPIILFNKTSGALFSHYYSGKNRQIPLPRKDDFSSTHPNSYKLRNESEITGQISQNNNNPEYLWVVTRILPGGNKNPEYKKYNYSVLENFLDKNYIVVNQKNFANTSVKLVRKK
jgi:hypothetical protein